VSDEKSTEPDADAIEQENSQAMAHLRSMTADLAAVVEHEKRLDEESSD
jgi:hypothetical protein